MSFIFLVLILVFIFGKTIYDECTKNRKAFTAEGLEQMNREMIGKSQKECQQILKKYSQQKK